MSETPWGLARFAYSYLGAVLAAIGGGLVAAIAYPIAGAVPICRGDEIGFCIPVLTGIAGAVGGFACLFLAAFFLNLSWQWAAWLVAWTLVLAEVVVESNTPGLAWICVALPGLSALLAFQRPDREQTKTWRIALMSVLAVLYAQFIVWLIQLIASPD